MDNLDRFIAWFAEQDLGKLEDVRDFVFAAAWENAGDCQDVLAAAKTTVELYLDCPEAAAEFDYYRRGATRPGATRMWISAAPQGS